ncbi:dihydrolipoyl dehydrogenase family protein [Naumannella huperziae]
MSDATDEFDVIVIGAGPTGENAAQYAIAGSDRTAALIESELVGGECSYWACMPSKALLLPGALADRAGAMGGLDGTELDPAGVLERRDAFTRHWDDASQVAWATDAGIEVIRGAGRLTGEREVTVGERTLRARHAVVLATGSEAVIPDIPGLRAARPWTNRDATALRAVPGTVLVLGGGVVACEAATWLATLGAGVIMVVRGRSLLPAAEPFAGERVAEALRRRGVQIRFGTELTEVTRDLPAGADPAPGAPREAPATCTLSDGTELIVDEIVVAAGRRPRTDDLGLDAAGLPPGTGIEVDDQLRVRGAEDWLYACGDVNGRAALTHMGKYQARVAGDVIAARAEGRPLEGSRYAASADHGQIPQVVFTEPEVASVGPTAAAAREAGHDIAEIELDIAVAGSSLARDDYAGRAKLVIDRATDTILGATFVGPDIAELLHAATVAVVGKVPLETLWHAVPAYPTVSEIWLRLLERARVDRG